MILEQHFPTELSVTMELLYSICVVQYGWWSLATYGY